MNKLAWATTTFVVALLPLSASPAAADAGFSVWLGDGCCYSHHRHGYPGWGRPVYVMPPPVVYAPPPMIYGAPPTVAFAAPPLPAVPTSPDFIDRAGRTCREYQSTVTVGGMRQPSSGTACLMADGSWRIMN